MTRRKTVFLGLFDWDKIYDPRRKVRILAYAFERVEEFMDPQDVQDLFNDYPATKVVEMINYKHRMRYRKNALELVNQDGQMAIKCAED